MARKAKKSKRKSKAKKVTKHAARKLRRIACQKKTMAKRVAKKPHKAKATKPRNPTKASGVEGAITSIEDIPHGDGYFIPYEKLISP